VRGGNEARGFYLIEVTDRDGRAAQIRRRPGARMDFDRPARRRGR